MTPADLNYIRGRADSTLRGDSGSIHAVSCADIRKLLEEREALLGALSECVTYDGAVAWRNAEMAGRRLESISQTAREAIQKATT